MPARVIRGEINASDSLARVSIGADLMFRALLVAVDDYGRFDARPQILRARLFPMRESLTSAEVAGWLAELTAGEAPPVALYEADGKPLLYLTGWRKHRSNSRRAKASLFPEPPSECTDADRTDEEVAALSWSIPEHPGASGTLPESPGDPPAGSAGVAGSEGVAGESCATTTSEKNETCGAADAAPPAPQLTLVEPPPEVDPLDGCWSEVQAAAVAYGKRWEVLNAHRRTLLRATLRDVGARRPGVLVELVHGYMAAADGHGPDFDPLRYLTPETVYAPSKRAKYLQAFDDATAGGQCPPFRVRPREGRRGAASAGFAPGARTSPRSAWDEP